MKKQLVTLLTGMMLGMALVSGGYAAANTALSASPTSQTFYVNGQKVGFEAYSIHDNNFIKLRDIGKAVDFGVTYDAATNSVYIDPGASYQEETPKPASTSAPAGEYTISADHWSREDFSQKANPAVFTGVYDRALYNTIRQTLVDGKVGSSPAYTMVAKGADYSAVKNLLGRMDGYFWYNHYVPQNFTYYYKYLDYFAVSVEISGDYQPALNFIGSAIEQVNGMASDREKVKYLNDYLCGLMSYDKKATAGISQVFAQHNEEVAGACGSYAHNFKFLCGAAGIPCFSVSTTNHSWNLVYADGKWLHVDAAANDLYRDHSVLLTETYPGHTDIAPEATAFLKELLVPGSTK